MFGSCCYYSIFLMLHKSILRTQSVQIPYRHHSGGIIVAVHKGVIIVVGFILLAAIAGIGVVKALTISSSGHTFHSKLKRNTDEDF